LPKKKSRSWSIGLGRYRLRLGYSKKAKKQAAKGRRRKKR